jgi:hypothetical protein
MSEQRDRGAYRWFTELVAGVTGAVDRSVPACVC